MQQRVLVVLAVLGAVAGLALLVMLYLMQAPVVRHPDVVAPPTTVPTAPDTEPRATTQSGTLLGRIIDGGTREGVAGAKILALAPYLAPAGEGEDAPRWGDLLEKGKTFSGPDGQFKLSDLPPDYWNLWVEKKGYAWATVPRAKFDVEHEIELFRACRVHGRVVYPDESPAAGVRIEYHVQGTHSEVFSHYALDKYVAATRADGTFEYTDLPPGKFTIEVYPQDHLPAPWAYEPALKPGDDRDLGTHKLAAGFTMTVRVLYRETREGVPDVEVVVRPMGDPMPRTKTGQRRRTDADGIARFQGLGGQVMDRPRFLVAANLESGPVLPDGGGMHEPGSDITIYLRKDGIVSGKVQRPDGSPLEQFFVELEAEGHITQQLRGRGENGGFRLLQVPEGPYTLYVRYGNLVDAWLPVQVEGGRETDVGTVTLREGAEIHGVVRRANGRELEGVVRVNLGRKARNTVGQEVWEMVGRSYVRKDGSYAIKGVPEGEFHLWPEAIDHPSHTTDPVPVRVEASAGAVQRDLLLYGEGFLNLKFMDTVKGQVTHVHAPPTYLIETATGEEIRWMGVGTRLRPGRYEVHVERKDADGVLKRYKVLDATVREREHAGQGTDSVDPIEIRLYEIPDGS